MTSADKPGHIAQCLELGILFEVSANKPGNITMVMGFEDTFYQHFLASAVAAAPSFRYAAQQGMKVAEGQIGVGEVGLGRIIKGCVEDIDNWQTGGNTLLGAVILLSPMAVAAGMTPAEYQYNFRPDTMRENLQLVVEATTP
ncbi:MAG: triphosphoribosyl-dephospho-CoA synthase, partial [Thermoproteota archaeon]